MKPAHLSLLRKLASHGETGMTVHGPDICTARILSRDGLASYALGKYTITYVGKKMLSDAKDRPISQ